MRDGFVDQLALMRPTWATIFKAPRTWWTGACSVKAKPVRLDFPCRQRQRCGLAGMLHQELVEFAEVGRDLHGRAGALSPVGLVSSCPCCRTRLASM